MTAHDIDKLLADIAAWKAADAAYREARKTLTGGAWVNRHTIDACAYLDECAMAVNGKFHESKTLAAFTTLAAHIRTLEAERDAAVAALRASNDVLNELHTDGAKADFPGYILGMGDLYQLQAQIDANNALLTGESE